MQRSYDDYINEMMRMYRAAAAKDVEYAELNKVAFAREVPVMEPAHGQKAESTLQKPVDMLPQPPDLGQKAEPAAQELVQPVLPQSAPQPENAEKPAEKSEQDMSGSGKLIVKVTTARGMLPVEDADVLISQTKQNGGAEIARLQTDSSGNTTPISLPAPPKYKSEVPQQPNDHDAVMAKYDIDVSAAGYADAGIKDAAVFDGVTSIQAVDMITESAANDETGEE